MVVLPPDITASLTAFGSTDAINSVSRFEEVVFLLPETINKSF